MSVSWVDSPERSPFKSIEGPLPPRPALGWLPFVVLAVAVVIDFFAFERVQPFAANLRIAAWAPACVILAVGGVGILILARDSISRRRFIAAIRIALAFVTLFAVAALAWLDWDVPTYLQYAPSSAATSEATAAVRLARPGGSCIIIRHSSTDLLPTPYQQCAEPPPAHRQGDAFYLVNWNQDLVHPSEYGFIFSPGAVPDTPDACLRHVDGPWWALLGMNEDDPGGPCPVSYQFDGGP